MEQWFDVIYYNRFACETQIFKVKAANAYRAGREFYRQHPRKQYYDAIERIIDA